MINLHPQSSHHCGSLKNSFVPRNDAPMEMLPNKPRYSLHIHYFIKTIIGRNETICKSFNYAYRKSKKYSKQIKAILEIVLREEIRLGATE